MKQLSPACLSISTIALQVNPPWMYKICKNLGFGGAPGHSPHNSTIFLCTFLFLFILLFCLQANPMKQLSPVCLSISTIALQVSPPWMYKICKNLRFGGWTCWPLSTQFHNLPLHIPLPLHLIILCASQPHETTISSLSFYRHHCSASQPPMNVPNLQEFKV